MPGFRVHSHIWLDHLETIIQNRRRVAQKAAQTRQLIRSVYSVSHGSVHAPTGSGRSHSTADTVVVQTDSDCTPDTAVARRAHTDSECTPDTAVARRAHTDSECTPDTAVARRAHTDSECTPDTAVARRAHTDSEHTPISDPSGPNLPADTTGG